MQYFIRYLFAALLIGLPLAGFIHSVGGFEVGLYSLGAAEIVVSNADQLENRAESAVAGDTIIVTDGVYDTGGSVTMTGSGTAENPIVIRAQNRGMAELRGETYFDLRQCAYIIIEGFVFASTDVTAIKLQACNNIRITRNVFRLNDLSSRKWVIIQGIWNDPNAQSHHNRIDHNLFEEKHMPGNFLTVDGSSDPVYQSSQHDRIDHNHFRNISPRHPNEMEALRVGWSELSMSSGFTVVEYNLFEGCDGDPEIISVKTSDDTIRYNTFRSSQGTLSLRHGNRSVVEGNFFFGEGKPGTGGVRVYGDDHKIFNNYFEGLTGTTWDAPITLTNGDYDGGGSLSKHFRINRAMVVNNTLVNNNHHIEIGFTNNGNYSKPPRDVLMANNLVWGKQNELVKVYTQPANMTWMDNLMYADSLAVMGITATPGEIYSADPLLTFSDQLWKLDSASPAIDSAAVFPYVQDDLDGQPRDGMPDIGADEYATHTVLRRPLTAADVGPDAPDVITGIETNRFDGDAPVKAFVLYQNYPNPFNPLTVIRYQLSKESEVRLEIVNLLGQRVKTMVSNRQPAGSFTVQWDGTNQAGNPVSSGLYLYLLTADGFTQTHKMMLIK